MNSTAKPRIILLKGGVSEEFGLSMQHAAEVAEILRTTNDYELLEIAIAKNGDWLDHGVARTPQDILQHTDGAYIALHGIYGEDGGVQRVLERHGVPYFGSTPYQSSIALNKILTKEMVQQSGIKTAPHIRVTREGVSDAQAMARTIESLFGTKYILKPMRGGSSIGNQVATSTLQLAQAMETMFSQYDDILVEQYIEGADATCGVVQGLRGSELYLTPVTELVHAADEATGIEAEKIAPGRFSKEQKASIEEITKAVHVLIGLKDISRSDFRVTPDGKVYFLEVNTLPAVTKDSPMMAGLESVGVSQEELVCHLCGSIIE